MTQKDILESVLKEIKHIKGHMPNGELKQMQADMSDLKEDISEMKYSILNPDNGVIVNTNKNTEYRQQLQANQKEFEGCDIRSRNAASYADRWQRRIHANAADC